MTTSSEKKEDQYFHPINPKDRIGFALVGLGKLTLGEILPAFGSSKYCKPVALVSGDADKAKKVAMQYGIPEKGIYNYENFDAIIDNPEVDVVYIVLPNSMHHEYTIRAAKAGKHVLCEKPMANSVKECEEMIDACKNANKKLMIAYRIQYEPYNTLCREWIQNQTYGKVKLMELNNGQDIKDPKAWRLHKALSGGGPLVDTGIYCLNTSRFLLAEEPEAVFATVHRSPNDERFREVEESMLFHLYFPSGVMASCSTTFGAHLGRRYRVFTDKETYFGMDPAFYYHGLKLEVSQAIGNMEWRSNPYQKEKNHFALEMDHLAQCIYNNNEPFTRGEEGLQDQQIMEAIYESVAQGKIIQLKKYNGKDVFRGSKPKSD